MRFRSLVFLLLGLIVGAPEARPQSNSDSNSSNNPIYPKLTLEYWNYYATSLSRLSGGAENAILRVLMPYKIDGVQQLLHIIPPLVTAPAAISGPRTGLGDTQIYNLTIISLNLGFREKASLGIGPLFAVPSNTSSNFGPNSLQFGLAGGTIAPQTWGILGVLATYQHTLWGPSSQLTTVQPNVFFNLRKGYYLRSSAIMQFNTYSHTDFVPVGFGVGKVIKFRGGYVLNVYAEAQPSVYHSGLGAPKFQVFTGVKLQFPPKLTSGWNINF